MWNRPVLICVAVMFSSIQLAQSYNQAPVTGCDSINTCIKNFQTSVTSATEFNYGDDLCSAIDVVLNCLQAAVSNTDCANLPDTRTFTFKNVLDEMKPYCTKEINTDIAPLKECANFKNCFDALKFPVMSNFFQQPKYWCGVLAAAIVCNSAVESDQACSPTAAVSSKPAKWCPEVDVKTKQFDQCDVDKNGCSHNCTYTDESKTYVCNCPEGFKLAADTKTCKENTQDSDSDSPTTPDTGCAEVDTCINTLQSSVKDTGFTYDTNVCGAVETALKCYDTAITACTSGSSNYKDPFEGKSESFLTLNAQLANYCSASVALSSCTEFDACFKKVKLPKTANDLIDPMFWCAIGQAAVTCDKNDTSDSENCNTVKSHTVIKTELDKTCPEPFDVLTKVYEKVTKTDNGADVGKYNMVILLTGMITVCINKWRHIKPQLL